MRLLFKKYYLPDKSIRPRLLISTGFGVTILLILIVFSPFGMQNIKTFIERFIVAFGYSIIAFICWFALLLGTRKIQPLKIELWKLLTIIFLFQIIMFRLLLKIVMFSACLMLNVSMQAQERALEQISYLPNELRLFIDSISTSTIYKEIPDFSFDEPPVYITKADAIEDIQTIKYILDNGYSGRYFWGQNGVNFERLYSNLLELVASTQDSISVIEIENILLQGFSKLNDGHSKIIGFKTTEFAKSKHAYFSEIMIEEQDSIYTVIQSNEKAVYVGMKYLDSTKYLFPTLSSTGRKHYLVGILSFEDILNLSLNFNGKPKSISLHRCRISNSKNTEQVFESEKKL